MLNSDEYILQYDIADNNNDFDLDHGCNRPASQLGNDSLNSFALTIAKMMVYLNI